MEKLYPCKCGNTVVVKYVAGMDKSLRQLSKCPFAGPTPTYYILCDKCGRHAYIRLVKPTAEHRDRCRGLLVRHWNHEVSSHASL